MNSLCTKRNVSSVKTSGASCSLCTALFGGRRFRVGAKNVSTSYVAPGRRSSPFVQSIGGLRIPLHTSKLLSTTVRPQAVRTHSHRCNASFHSNPDRAPAFPRSRWGHRRRFEATPYPPSCGASSPPWCSSRLARGMPGPSSLPRRGRLVGRVRGPSRSRFRAPCWRTGMRPSSVRCSGGT